MSAQGLSPSCQPYRAGEHACTLAKESLITGPVERAGTLGEMVLRHLACQIQTQRIADMLVFLFCHMPSGEWARGNLPVQGSAESRVQEQQRYMAWPQSPQLRSPGAQSTRLCPALPSCPPAGLQHKQLQYEQIHGVKVWATTQEYTDGGVLPALHTYQRGCDMDWQLSRLSFGLHKGASRVACRIQARAAHVTHAEVCCVGNSCTCSMDRTCICKPGAEFQGLLDLLQPTAGSPGRVMTWHLQAVCDPFLTEWSLSS